MEKNTKIKTRFKKNDTVKVVAGNSRGTVGKLLFIDRQKGRVIVEGVNIMHKHTKPSQKSQQGGIVKREAPINIANIMLMCPKTNKPTRIGMSLIKDEKTGKLSRMRSSKQSGEIII